LVDELFLLPPVTQAEVDRWDKEWMVYFATEDRAAHLRHYEHLTLIEDLKGKSAEEVFGADPFVEARANGSAWLRIWIEAEAVLGRDVLEIGCGCGWLGKRLGLLAHSYLGLDFSEFAIAVARGVSPPNCRYLHLSERNRIAAQQGQFDTMVGREFFIHQNYANACWVLQLGAFLLRHGGQISADFFLPNRETPRSVWHLAREPLDPVHASCGYLFNETDLGQLARETGLELLEIVDRLNHQRRFARFRKSG
jgi:SAM-dependent methyltransferase